MMARPDQLERHLQWRDQPDQRGLMEILAQQVTLVRPGLPDLREVVGLRLRLRMKEQH